MGYREEIKKKCREAEMSAEDGFEPSPGAVFCIDLSRKAVKIKRKAPRLTVRIIYAEV